MQSKRCHIRRLACLVTRRGSHAARAVGQAQCILTERHGPGVAGHKTKLCGSDQI